MTDRVNADPWTYFGTWSKKEIKRIIPELVELNIRYEAIDHHQDEEYLRQWYSWDKEAKDPSLCFHLYIHDDDYNLIGDYFIVRFPHREYLNPKEKDY